MRWLVCICCLALLTTWSQAARGAETEVLYERELTEEERASETIGYRESPIVTADVIEKTRAAYQDPERIAKLPRQGIFKVELVYEGQPDRKEARIRVYAIGEYGRRWARDRKEEQWCNEATPQITLGEDKDGFKFESRYIGFSSGERIYYAEQGAVGWAEEKFTGPNGQGVTALIYKGIKQAIPLHEFLHGVIRSDFRVVQTNIGAVIVRNIDPRFRSRGAQVAWTCGEDVAVYIGGSRVDPLDLVKLYGDKFPSSLPKDLKVDKTEWGQREVELGLERMKAALAKGPAGPQFSIGSRLRKNAYIPPWESVQAHYDELLQQQGHLTSEQQVKGLQEIVEVVQEWWEENRDNTYWDEEAGKLVAKGQTPKEVAEAARKKAEAEEQARRDAILNSPMTLQQIADAKAKLIAMFEKEKEGRARQDAKSRGERGGDRVKWEKVRDGEWTYAFPDANNGPLIVDTFTGPDVEATGVRERPLRAAFQMKRASPSQVTYDFVVEYVYDRLNDVWKGRAPRQVK